MSIAVVSDKNGKYVLGDNDNDKIKLLDYGYRENGKFLFYSDFPKSSKVKAINDFRVFDDNYFADDQYVYFNGERIKNSNAKSFQYFGNSCGKDIYGFIFKGERINKDCRSFGDSSS